jgi:FkbM family methyltransferase
MNRRQLLELRLRKLAYSARRPALWGPMRAGVVPSVDHAALIRRLRPATVIDVGAHSGQFALLVRSECPKAKVISFEPQPEPGAQYRRFLGASAELRMVALGETMGEATLNVTRASDSSSLLPIGEEQVTRFPGTDRVAELTVPVSTLDTEFPDPCSLAGPVLLKIDVQGFELAVLRGAAGLLAVAQWIYVELSFVELYSGQPLAPAVIRFLDDHGFEMSGAFNMSEGPNGESVQADFLFTRAHPRQAAA